MKNKLQLPKYEFGNKSDEEVKNDVLTELYNTGRIQGFYMIKYSNNSANPIKELIKKKMHWKLNDEDLKNELCEECYQLTFQHLSKLPAAKFVEMLKISITYLTATAVTVMNRNCFAVKYNTAGEVAIKTSGIVHRILDTSTFGNLQINPIERNEEDKKSLIIYDENEDSFTDDFGFSVEELIDRLSEEDRIFFYQSIGKQKVGKPSKEMLLKRAELKNKILEIKKQIDNEKNR